jgi:hypothetical protein
MHTRGPWSVSLNYDNKLSETINGRHTIKADSGYNIARIWENGPNPTADAYLIGQAPNLLEIAKSACSLWGFMRNDTSLPSDERLAAERAYAHACDVIAKAEA